MNLFELFAKISIKDDGFKDGIDSARKNFGDFTSWTVAKGQLIADGIKQGANALIDFGKQSIESYSEYEQLAGGVQKIFDEMDNSRIFQDAANAYKDLGLSANQYLATINDVGATFAATMGDEAGYETAKRGLQAISDYASGTGKNVDLLSEKFTLITRATSSYQSIADQFSGILPATSADFLEQAQAAGFLSDSYTKLTEVPVAEYQAAVSEMLKKGVEDLGLAGNTAAEASTTISGSLAAARSAFENLVTGIADGSADIDLLLNNFVESVGIAAKNVIPVAGTIAGNIIKIINDNAPEFVKTAWSVVQNLVDGIVEKTPELVPAATGAVTEFIETITSPESLSEIFDMGLDLLMSLADGIIDSIPVIIDSAPVVVQNLVDATIRNAPKLLKSGLELVLKLTEGILSNLPKLVDSGLDIVSAIIEGIVRLGGDLVMTGKDIVDEVKDGFWQKVDDARTWGRDLIDNFIGGIKEKWTSLKNTVSSVAQTVKDYIGFSEPKEGPLSNFHTYAPDMMELFAKGIRDNEGMLRNQISKSFDFSVAPISVDTFSSVNYNRSTTKSSRMGAVEGGGNSPMTIIVQSVLDGKIIGETAYQYSKNKQRAYGV